MSFFRSTIVPVVTATVWISISEFVRNQYLLLSYWSTHYRGLGLTFPAQPVNGAVWGLWSLCFAILVFILSKRFSLTHTVGLCWFIAFVLMWLVIGNLGVLPFGILFWAVPLSMLETFVAALIIRKMSAR